MKILVQFINNEITLLLLNATFGHPVFAWDTACFREEKIEYVNKAAFIISKTFSELAHII